MAQDEHDVQDGPERGPGLFPERPRTAAGARALAGLQALSDSVHESDEVALQALGMRSIEALALQQLVQADGEGRRLNPTQLSGLLRLTTAGVTKLVDRLVRAGRAERRRNPEDRRGIVVVPTESARSDLARAYGHVHGPVIRVIDDLTDDEATAVGRFADRLAAALRDERPVGGDTAAAPSSAPVGGDAAAAPSSDPGR
jgi:DNA-binding MarR family transcriptional regulator